MASSNLMRILINICYTDASHPGVTKDVVQSAKLRVQALENACK